MKRAQWVLAVALVLTASPSFAQLGSVLSRGAKTASKIRDLNISEEDERKIGGIVSEQVRKKYGVAQDAAVHRYVALVGATLTRKSTRPSLGWQFIVLDTDGVNAFAAPGGFVHITRGALALLKSEAELAGVLAHEVVHVTEQHTIGAIKKNKMKEIGTDFAPTASGALSQAVVDRLGNMASDMVMQGFGRGEELESDEKGIALANAAGYSPKGLSAFLRSLQDRNKSATEKQGLFASHPEMNERLEKIDKEIASQKLTAAATLADRLKRFIAYTPKAQTDVATVEAGSAGLVGGKPAKGKEDDKKAEPKKRGFGLGRLTKGGGDENKSAQVVGSGGSRGVDTERNAKGGSNPAVVAVKLTPADVDQFRTEGKLA